MKDKSPASHIITCN